MKKIIIYVILSIIIGSTICWSGDRKEVYTMEVRHQGYVTTATIFDEGQNVVISELKYCVGKEQESRFINGVRAYVEDGIVATFEVYE